MKNRPLLSLIIPAYNEENRIQKALNKIIKYLEGRGYPYEIIIIDDGSSDDSVKVINKLSERYKKIKLLQNENNKGKGYSVKKGMLSSNGLYVLFSDADLSTPIEEIEKFFSWLRCGYDIVIGSRALEDSDVQIHQPWYRETMGKIFNVLVRFLAIKGIKDTQCGFKCFKREVIPSIFTRQTIDRFGFDVELLWIASKKGLRTKEVPVQWFNDSNSRVNPLTDGISMLYELLKIRINDLMGKYR